MPAPAFRLFFNLENAKAFASIVNHTLNLEIQEQGLSASPFDIVHREREMTIGIDSGHNISAIYPVESLELDLRGYTMERLAEFLNSRQGFQASVILPRYNKMVAAALIDDVLNADLSSSKDFALSTNPLWVFLRPLAWALEDHANSADTALAQLNILTSRGHFADFWGDFLDVVRRSGETDVSYVERIVRTILLKRDNNRAIEQIVYDEFGMTVTVDDLWPTLLELNNTPVFSRLPGQVYNIGTFLVTGSGITQAVIDLVNKHRAGGTRAFFRSYLDVEIAEPLPVFDIQTFDVSVFDLTFPDIDFNLSIDVNGDMSEIESFVPDWLVEDTAMPGSRIV